ncbi:ATP-binding cassette domain-containing protein [Mesorhizobium sp. VK23B]|uniref:ATP-binding cassette domain-containing protein n=1 Tax=Mesorhizobium dulcispinae TaxID=3072316 RepID=A0ABU4XR83_9HYPH|nr:MULTISPECIES: ATP-binding cassette domain-containing protein [unclassified Mesorhizobium]MDX8469725.1 ATP-binding cassette domain-containing protein [Mesorhizobium sp. VK23B]MDX8476064.1 ATP-binding cassette domain-containing protein [Mesorhizobium sp. VK23A]
MPTVVTSDTPSPAQSRVSRLQIWAAFASFLVLAPSLVLGGYSSGLLVQAFIFGTVALITDIVWGYSGVLTFASAAMFGIGAYALGILFVHLSPSLAAVAAALAIAVIAAGLLSAVIGWLAFYSRTKVSDFYVAVVTLGVSVVFEQAVLYGGATTGGSNGLSGFTTFSLNNQSWYVIGGIGLLAFGGTALRIVGSDFGLILRAIRDNEARCRYIGIRTPLIKTVVFSVCNALLAAVGVFYSLYTTVVAPSLVGMTLATNVLIWVILGGRATIIGPALAAILVTVATPQLTTTIPLYWQGLLGLTFVLVVLFLPRGILPAIWDGIKSALSVVGLNTTIMAKANANADTLFETRSPALSSVAGQTVLDVLDVSKRFGSFQALTNVSLTVQRGELLSIVGPNGAGKTSLVKCISDGDERSSGSILIGGKSIEHNAPELITRLGVGRKFQAASIFETLTVGECIKIATWKGEVPSIWNRHSNVVLPRGAAEVAETLGLKHVWDISAKDISHGQRQALELAMVLALEPSVLILDEPTAGLTTHERSIVGDVLMRLLATGQLAIILIEHDFEFVKRISTRIVVLVNGQIVANGTVEEVSNSEIVRDAYLGRSHKENMK